MKKLYTFVMLMLAVGVMFAQQQKPIFKAVSNPMESIKIANQNLDTKADKPGQNGWFNYAQGMAIYMYGEEYGQYLSQMGHGMPMLADRIGKYPFSNGKTIPQIQSFAQVFDFSKPRYWTEMYETVGSGFPVPGTGTAWGIDSVELFFNFVWGKEVPLDVVDTLIVSFAVNMDGEDTYYIGQQYMNLYIPPFSLETFTFDESRMKTASVYTTKFELDTSWAMPVDDQGRSSYYVVRLPAPEEVKNLDCHTLAISYTYRATLDNRNDSTTMGTDMNTFAGLSFKDPRPEYQTNAWGSSELLGNMNSSMFAGAESFKPSSESWYKMYCPTIMWDLPHLRPYIGFHMTNCEGCGLVKVNDLENKKINVYPNPATSTVNVQLVDNSQANIQLFNLVGQVVMSEQVNGQDLVTLNVNNLNNGIYMLKVNQNGKVYTSKVVVR